MSLRNASAAAAATTLLALSLACGGAGGSSGPIEMQAYVIDPPATGGSYVEHPSQPNFLIDESGGLGLSIRTPGSMPTTLDEYQSRFWKKGRPTNLQVVDLPDGWAFFHQSSSSDKWLLYGYRDLPGGAIQCSASPDPKSEADAKALIDACASVRHKP